MTTDDLYAKTVKTFTNDLVLAGPELTYHMRDACTNLARLYLPPEEYAVEKFAKLFCEHFYFLESSIAQQERIDSKSLSAGRCSPVQIKRGEEILRGRIRSELARATRFWTTVFAAAKRMQDPEKG